MYLMKGWVNENDFVCGYDGITYNYKMIFGAFHQQLLHLDLYLYVTWNGIIFSIT